MPDDAQVDPRETIDSLRRELAARSAERDEALAERAAISEIVQIINRSGGDLGPVFDAMLEKALRLCEAAFGMLWTYDGELVQFAAARGHPRFDEWTRGVGPSRVHPGSTVERLLRGEPVVHILDAREDEAYRSGNPRRRLLVDVGGARSYLTVPLRKGDNLVGAFAIYRQEVRPFSDKQIALLQNFAPQAVIAMESARLLGELRERTQELTSREGALRRSEERYALAMRAINEGVYEWDVATGSMYYSPRVCELVGLEPSELRTMTDWTDRIHPDDRQSFRNAVVAHFKGETDWLAAEYRYRHVDGSWHWARHHGIALKNKAGRAYRVVGSTGDITDRKAAEEALREALEQQTATAEVLQVINSSPDDLAPVFDAMLEKAMRLCGADFGVMNRYDGKHFYHAADHGVPSAYARYRRERGPITYGSGTTPARLVAGENLIHTANLMATEAYERGEPARRALVDLGRARTHLTAALRKGDVLLGDISIYRQEVRPFSDKQTALLQNFAAQAVIAMENARLLAETREALEQQTATAEVLQVINSSPGNLAPVFDAILEKAHSLCDVAHGTLCAFDGQYFRMVATRGMPDQFVAVVREPFRGNTFHEQLISGQRYVQIGDALAATSELSDPVGRAALEHTGMRTTLLVPLRKDDKLLGYIGANRLKVRPFSEKEIALLENFAAQAVIAMENARLLIETREALEQQTATAEVLQVINSSPGDLTPVFDAVLEKALALCGAAYGGLATFDGECFHFVAGHGDPEYVARMRQSGAVRPAPGSTIARIVAGEDAVQIVDIADDEVYRAGIPGRRMLVDIGGFHTLVSIALRQDNTLLGALQVYRQEVLPFTDKQIALLQNFAAEAVIAMENARLLTETREALEQQTATAEVLQVINSSPGDLAPVFDAMLEKAVRLCEASFGHLTHIDGELFYTIAERGAPPPLVEFLRQPRKIMPENAHSRLRRGEDFVHLEDITTDDLYRSGNSSGQALGDLGSARTALWAALRKDDTLLGAFVIYRREVRPFSDKQIALLQNFAAQAVIAIENARLLTETREALEQQTATAEVLQVINASPGDLTPVFETILEKAHSLCGVAYGSLELYDGENFRSVAERGLPKVFAEMLQQGYPASDNPATRPLIEGSRFTHIADLAETDYSITQSAAEFVNIRTLLCIPLRRNSALRGMIACARQEVRLFSDKEIALLESFAAQAVVAMENARLLGELRDRTHDLEESLEYQTATSDVLKVISRSTFDLQPMLQTVLDTAVRLCRAGPSEIFRMEDDGYRFAVGHGMTPEYEALERAVVIHPDPGTLVGRTALERRVVHVFDAWTDPQYSQKEEARIGNFHTMLGVPLMREGVVAGMIALSRRLVEPFSEREIQLVTTFADQAVIAIENTRLLTELREALEQQTATAEILEVINRSPGDLAPVFDAILEKAHSLCGAALGSLQLYDGDSFRAVAIRGQLQAVAERLQQPRQPDPTNPSSQLLAGERFVHVPDAAEIDSPTLRNIVKLAGLRTVLYVALRKEDTLLGFIGAGRAEVRLFSDKQIALLESFAAQAVIAIDNARLLDETRQRQAELRVTFDNMGDGVAMFDGELRLAAWNMNFQHILDLPGELLAERLPYADYIRFLARRGEYGSADIEAELNRRLEGLVRESRFEHTRPDGRIIEVRRNAVPGGGFVVIYSDVTERKRAEEEIRAARDTAEKALQELQMAQASLLHAQKMAALGQLTAGIAHEIKNPLNFVNNFAELSGELLLELKETTAPAVAALADDERAAVDEVVEMLRGNLDKIAEHGKRADGIVKSMLEHSRGVSGERRSVDLNALIEEALNLAYHGARAQDASFNITLERDFDRDLMPTELAPQEMTRVFLNLFGNGFYATAKRHRDGAGAGFRPTLKVVTRDLGDAVEVRVRDNGTGIAPEIRDKLFQPFVTTKPTGEGTGLGLSISYDIVTQQHGGMIEVDSRVGEFTEFTIRLPRPR